MPSNVPHPEAVLRGHRGEVQALDFDGGERFLVSGDSLGEVRVWDLADLRPAAIRRLHPLTGGILSLRLFKSGGQLLLGTQGRDGNTMLWGCADSAHDLQISEEPVRSFVRDCYSFCRFAVLPGEPQEDSSASTSSAPLHSSGQDQQQQQQQQQQKLADEFVASVLAEEQPGSSSDAAGELQPQRDQQDQQTSSSQGPGDDAAAAGTPAASSPGNNVQGNATGAAIWALHPCSQASEQHPTALLAIPGRDERTAEVVCCSCGRQLAEFREEAAGRKLGMLMAMQLYCIPAVAAAPAPAAPSTAQPPSAMQPPLMVCLAAGYEDGSLVVWEVAGAAQAAQRRGQTQAQAPLAQRQLCQEPLMALQIDSSCTGGACGSAEREVVCFKVDHAARRISVRHSIELKAQGIGDVAVRPDRKLLATAGWDGKVRLYKYKSGRPLAILKYHSSPVTGIQFAPKSMLLATAARDGTLALWPLFQPEQNQ